MTEHVKWQDIQDTVMADPIRRARIEAAVEKIRQSVAAYAKAKKTNDTEEMKRLVEEYGKS